MTTDTVIQQLNVNGNVVTLPPVQLDRDVYVQVKSKLEKIGGRWKGGKVQGFVFPNDPTNEIARIQSGEKVNLKQEFQFFATPDALADRMVELAEIEPFHSILEPSAGQGAIVKAINRVEPLLEVHCFELMETNRAVLDQVPTVIILGNDFLAEPTVIDQYYDRIIANPPFTNNQDIDHILDMMECLAENGRIVTISSLSWVIGSQKKQVEFRELMDRRAVYREELPTGTFRESGTNVGAMLLVIE